MLLDAGGALPDAFALHVGDHHQDAKHQTGDGGVEDFPAHIHQVKTNPLVPQEFRDLQRILRRAEQTVALGDDDVVPLAEFREQPGSLFALLETHGSAGRRIHEEVARCGKTVGLAVPRNPLLLVSKGMPLVRLLAGGDAAISEGAGSERGLALIDYRFAFVATRSIQLS